jgi:hypothetical protein
VVILFPERTVRINVFELGLREKNQALSLESEGDSISRGLLLQSNIELKPAARLPFSHLIEMGLNRLTGPLNPVLHHRHDRLSLIMH